MDMGIYIIHDDFCFDSMHNTRIIASYSNLYFTLLKSTVCANLHFKE